MGVLEQMGVPEITHREDHDQLSESFRHSLPLEISNPDEGTELHQIGLDPGAWSSGSSISSPPLLKLGNLAPS